jgi:hypothetical protein
MVIDNHGKFSEWCDWEWDLNPYNSKSPDQGPALNAEDFFVNEDSRRMHRNKLRYIAARWGADTTVMGWELVSEYDLVGGRTRGDQGARVRFHRSPVLKAWAKEMIGHLRECDAYDHPTTNHYATDYTWIDAELARTPSFDYVVGDVYRPLGIRYSEFAERNQGWFRNTLHASGNTKPFWITEYGGDFYAAPLQSLHADVHCGIWSTWMTEGAGVPLFWWYDVIERLNLYGYYGAFAKYIAGEDRRGIKGETVRLPVQSGGRGQMKGQAYVWNEGAYAWVYSDAAMTRMPTETSSSYRFENTQSSIPGLQPGTYTVEYWDCYTGTVAKTDTVNLTDGNSLELQFPPFNINMAVKVKRQK